MFKLDNFGVIWFVSFSYKNCYNVHFMKIEKINAKIDFSEKNSKKFVYYNEELVTNSKFQTQFSQKLQRFRTCRKNKKCSIFHDLSEYIIFSYDCKLLDWPFKPNPKPDPKPDPKLKLDPKPNLFNRIKMNLFIISKIFNEFKITL